MATRPPTPTLQRFDPRPLFDQVRSSLIHLLADLTASEWEAPTPAGDWLVRDIVAHLLGDDLGRLSRSRDGYQGPAPRPDETLSQFLDRLNDRWVRAWAGISPDVLQDVLAMSSQDIRTLWKQAELDDVGEPVSWIRPGQQAPVWLDCARDFTEDWIHQQQVRLAIGRQEPTDPSILRAVLDTFMHAMSYTLEQAELPDGYCLAVRIETEISTCWSWSHDAGRWTAGDLDSPPTTQLVADPATWWQLCVRMLTPDQARQHIEAIGDERLARSALNIVSIIRDP